MFINIFVHKNISKLSFFHRNISNGLILCKSHYDSLGITPKATRADVKSAYYKLSKLYHPDKNQGCVDSSRKFQEVSNAYEVLGNYKLRKLYDKGLLHPSDRHQTYKNEEPPNPHPQAKFYESRQSRRTYSGKTPIYDFDEWSRMHYEETFQRRQRAKQRYDDKQQKIIRDAEDIKSEQVIWSLLALTFIFIIFTGTMNSDDYDKIKKPN